MVPDSLHVRVVTRLVWTLITRNVGIATGMLAVALLQPCETDDGRTPHRVHRSRPRFVAFAKWTNGDGMIHAHPGKIHDRIFN